MEKSERHSSPSLLIKILDSTPENYSILKLGILLSLILVEVCDEAELYAACAAGRMWGDN
jgi:hypothetical protein